MGVVIYSIAFVKESGCQVHPAEQISHTGMEAGLMKIFVQQATEIRAHPTPRQAFRDYPEKYSSLHAQHGQQKCDASLSEKLTPPATNPERL
jgi:hypothetical protein